MFIYLQFIFSFGNNSLTQSKQLVYAFKIKHKETYEHLVAFCELCQL